MWEHFELAKMDSSLVKGEDAAAKAARARRDSTCMNRTGFESVMQLRDEFTRIELLWRRGMLRSREFESVHDSMRS